MPTLAQYRDMVQQEAVRHQREQSEQRAAALEGYRRHCRTLLESFQRDIPAEVYDGWEVSLSDPAPSIPEFYLEHTETGVRLSVYRSADGYCGASGYGSVRFPLNEIPDIPQQLARFVVQVYDLMKRGY